MLILWLRSASTGGYVNAKEKLWYQTWLALPVLGFEAVSVANPVVLQ